MSREYKVIFIDGSTRVINEQYAGEIISGSDRLRSIVNERMKQHNASKVLNIFDLRDDIKGDVFIEMWKELHEKGKILLDTYIMSLEVVK